MMVEFIGEKNLIKYIGSRKKAQIKKITDNVYALQYFGSSNAILIIGDNGCILVDAFETDGYAKEARDAIEKITDKPITTIIYTHTHADHIGGAKIFEDTVQTVIGHKSNNIVVGQQEKIANDAQRRAVRQFGALLSSEEALSLGISPLFPPKGIVNTLPITMWIEGDVTDLTIEGIKIQLIAAPGETDEEEAVWLPEQRVFCGGDNYYASWPNLSALRGSTYRDVNQWVQSLKKYLNYPVEYYIPGHGDILVGNSEFREIIGTYSEAIEWVLEKTLEGINVGKTPDELVEIIDLPEKWKNIPYLQEYYGTIAWSIRGIYAGYVGWFDGNPTHIGSMPVKKRAEKIIGLLGDVQVISKEIKKALTEGEMQWVLELCDILLDAQVMIEEARKWKSEACSYLGRMQTSANGRHYYLTCAKELIK
ncbi:MAG: alkyl/aryl-sulfatase [Peptococcaceae bacterium]|nr:alkyl/aryl-sulfatase [Peptococcaceae bacterium]